MGRPVQVSEFLTAVLNIQEMADDKDPALEHYKKIIDDNGETDWPDFQHSSNAEIDQKINEAPGSISNSHGYFTWVLDSVCHGDYSSSGAVAVCDFAGCGRTV